MGGNNGSVNNAQRQNEIDNPREPFHGWREVLRKAADSAVIVYNDVDDPETLSPVAYEGDGEAFQIDWLESLSKTEYDRDTACEVYLAAFWNEIERLQNA